MRITIQYVAQVKLKLTVLCTHVKKRRTLRKEKKNGLGRGGPGSLIRHWSYFEVFPLDLSMAACEANGRASHVHHRSWRIPSGKIGG